jgi:hypothetical protein
MRIVSEITNPSCKITIFSWNNRYILKFEQGYLEQTYKIDQFEITNEQDLNKLINDELINPVLQLFETMRHSLQKALHTI